MNPLTAEQLRGDPRLAEARRLIGEAVADHQRKIDGPMGADPARAEEYRKTIERFGEVRGGALYYPYLGSGIGRGALVELADGSVKYDMISGIGVHGLGHSDGELIDALVMAAVSDTVMQGNLQQNVESAALCDDLVRIACEGGAGLRHCFLSTSGATANENALKLIFQKHHPADRLLAFGNCFMGRTIAMAAITDRAQYRQGIPVVLKVDYVPFYEADDPKGSTERAVAVMRGHVERYPGGHAGFCFELVQGEGGYIPGTREFIAALMGECKKRGIAVLADEIQTFARLPRPLAFQHFGLDGMIDVATVGKITQACATLFSDAYRPKGGLISQTFTGATSSIVAARHILKRLMSGGFYGTGGRIEKIHERFVGRLSEMAGRHPERIGGPWGIGAMIACRVFDGSGEVTGKVLRELYEAGVIGFVAGSNPHRLRFLPPIGVVSDEEIDAACGILDGVLARVAERGKG